jgi:hypothetical protein
MFVTFEKFVWNVALLLVFGNQEKVRCEDNSIVFIEIASIKTCYPPWILVLVCCLKSKERYSNPTGHPKLGQHGSTQSKPSLGQITGLNVARSKESGSNPQSSPLKSGVMGN